MVESKRIKMSSDVIINAVIDLSHWNENINFKLAREDGILGVIHKATQGLKYVDRVSRKGTYVQWEVDPPG